MIRLLTAYLITGVAFALIDSVWLKTMLPRLYQPEIGGMLAPQLRMGPAIAFYLLYILGIMWFAYSEGKEAFDKAANKQTSCGGCC